MRMTGRSDRRSLVSTPLAPPASPCRSVAVRASMHVWRGVHRRSRDQPPGSITWRRQRGLEQMAPRPIRIEPAEKPPFRAPEDSDGLVVTHILELPLDLRPPPGREVTRSSGRRPRREHRVGELGVDPLFVDTSQCPGFDGVGAGRRGFESRADARDDFVLSCRVYRNGRGLSGHPDENWIREALIKAVA